MKKSYQILLIGSIAFGLLLSCNSETKNEQQQEENFQEQMDGFSESMEDIDQTMELVNYLNNKLQQIENKVETGQLTREEGNRLAKELNDNYRREIARRSNLNPATHLPTWASDLGLLMPQNMVLDNDFSKKTSIENDGEGFNSIKLVFIGDYQTAIEQASLIAKNANVPMSKEYAKAYEMAERYPSAKDEIKGVSYMNYELGDTDVDYKISISVDDRGKLTLIAVDENQRKDYLKKIRGQ